jgi:hypothetical protein
VDTRASDNAALPARAHSARRQGKVRAEHSRRARIPRSSLGSPDPNLTPRIPRSKPSQSVLVEFSSLETTRDLLDDLYVNGGLESRKTL